VANCSGNWSKEYSSLIIHHSSCYSYGDSAGLSPASLLMIRLRRTNQLRGGKCRKTERSTKYCCTVVLYQGAHPELFIYNSKLIPTFEALSSSHGKETKAAAF
jgi:hypothetical protein